MVNKTLWMAIVSGCALIGMWLSLLTLNLVHAIIIGFKIFAIWTIKIVVLYYIIFRDEYSRYKKNKQKRLKK